MSIAKFTRGDIVDLYPRAGRYLITEVLGYWDSAFQYRAAGEYEMLPGAQTIPEPEIKSIIGTYDFSTGVAKVTATQAPASNTGTLGRMKVTINHAGGLYKDLYDDLTSNRKVKIQCDHDWKPYVGLMHRDYYCTKCNEKKAWE